MKRWRWSISLRGNGTPPLRGLYHGEHTKPPRLPSAPCFGTNTGKCWSSSDSFQFVPQNKENTPWFFLAGDFGWRQATRRANIKLVFSLFIIIVIRHNHLLQLDMCRVMNFGRFGLALVPITIIIIYKSSQTPTPPPSSRTSPETLRLALPHTQMRWTPPVGLSLRWQSLLDDDGDDDFLYMSSRHCPRNQH